jgi:hypothetical protein
MAIKIDKKGMVRILGRLPRNFQASTVEQRTAWRGADSKVVPSILADVLLETDPQLANGFSVTIGRDDELTRRDLASLEGGLGTVVEKYYLPLAATIEKISRDLNLSREGKKEKMWSEVDQFMSKLVRFGKDPLHNLMSLEVQIAEIFKGALDPEIPDENKVEHELHKREVRDFLRQQGESDRAMSAISFGENANLVALEAIESDPLGNGLVPQGVMDGAKKTAVVAQGGEWIIQEQKSTEKSLDSARRRVHFFEISLMNGLTFRGLVGTEDYPYGSLLEKMERAVGLLDDNAYI